MQGAESHSCTSAPLPLPHPGQLCWAGDVSQAAAVAGLSSPLPCAAAPADAHRHPGCARWGLRGTEVLHSDAGKLHAGKRPPTGRASTLSTASSGSSAHSALASPVLVLLPPDADPVVRHRSVLLAWACSAAHPAHNSPALPHGRPAPPRAAPPRPARARPTPGRPDPRRRATHDACRALDIQRWQEACARHQQARRCTGEEPLPQP